MIRRITSLLMLISIMAFGACSTGNPNGPPVAEAQDVTRLAQGIMALGPDVDPKEASRAAQIAYDYTHQLAIEYQITDSPLIHNMKVNRGTRPRGLCWHWAEDMEARLKQENFRTLEMHRAIANADNRILIDHSTAIVSRRGDTMFEGMVIDPWRYGGVLHWSPTLADTRYQWVPRMEVLAKRAAERKKQTVTRSGLSLVN